MSIEDLIIRQIQEFERTFKIEKLIYNFKRSAPLEKYVIYMKLKKIGVNMPYDY